MMFVIGPVVVAVKYEMDWALASFWSVEVPIAVFPKVDEVGVGVGVIVEFGVFMGVGFAAPLKVPITMAP